MSRSSRESEDTIKRHSGWLIPLAVFVVTAVLSALILVFYLAPTPASFIEEHPSPTARTDPVYLSVGGFALSVPANYLVYSNTRQGGAHKEVDLYATFPDFRGYSDWESQTFAGNNPDSPVIYLLIREDRFNIGEAAHLQRVYLGYVTDAQGRPGPFGLTQYFFRNDSGYRGDDLFVGQTRNGAVVMNCERLSQTVPSPSCLRDTNLSRGVALSYRFKRAQLANWREIAAGVSALVHSFAEAAK